VRQQNLATARSRPGSYFQFDVAIFPEKIRRIRYHVCFLPFLNCLEQARLLTTGKESLGASLFLSYDL